MKITLQLKDEKPTEIKAEPHAFKSGSNGFYFRERVNIGGKSYHVQMIISEPK